MRHPAVPFVSEDLCTFFRLETIMSFLKHLFGAPSPERVMYMLLSGPGSQMADEMERVYRGQIGMYSRYFSECQISGRGILKASLRRYLHGGGVLQKGRLQSRPPIRVCECQQRRSHDAVQFARIRPNDQ